ncbi:PKD repeat protein [Spirosoma oryzae]|uniref:PKD repeat protein n=1 Tax=Spirosoma oryzae TaxID=1469603 RepID=A0A2T0T0I1_9BACT|nr:PKD domain-containing protein [Spirosoma oryzae]PRY39170.1 PKD repeat protein [Spirosoma oryzae]
MKATLGFWLLSLAALTSSACYREMSIPVKADFSIKATNDNFTPPASIQFTNLTTGADAYQWTFPGGTPGTSTDKTPAPIRYTTAGSYTVKLVVSNVDGEQGTKELTLKIGDKLVPAFQAEVVGNLYPPATINIKNRSLGGDRVVWTFDGGSPATSTDANPSVTFATPGPHKVSLQLFYGSFAQQKDTTIVVAPDLAPAFTYQLSPEDYDEEAPLTLTTQNQTVGGTSYTWSVEGGTVASPTAKETAITFAKEGTYTIKLDAGNTKKNQSVSRTIVVKPNRNLYTLTDVKLGINAAQKTIGSFLSTSQNRVFKADEVLTAKDGASIDVVFFGLNPSFTYNRFVSPTDAGNLTFDDIPGAQAVRFVNLLENCQTCSTITATQFEQMTDDTWLRTLPIPEQGETVGFSNKQVPRFVLFQTQQGRKGIIQISRFVEAGESSYVLCSVKVMKETR